MAEPRELPDAVLHAIVEHLPDMVFVKEAAGLTFVQLNAAAERLIGWPRDALLGRGDRDFFPEEEARFFIDKDRAVLESRALLDIPEEPLHTGHQGVRWLHTKKIPLVGPDGEPAYLLGISRDITELREARRSVEARAYQLRVVLEHFPGVVWTTDREGRITWGAGARSARFGPPPIGSPVDAWLPAPREGGLGALHAAAAGGMPLTFDLNHEDLEFEGRLVPSDEGVIGVALDVTERRRLAQERLEVHLQRTQRMEALGMLAGGIAHDFNNLLVGILGHLSLALTHVEGKGPVRHHIERAESAAERAADLTRQMLAYSGKGRFVVEPVDLSALVLEMADLLRVSISKRASLTLDTPPGLPRVEADASQLRQVAMNLLTNASDALDGNAGTIRVTVRSVAIDHRRDAVNHIDLPAGWYVSLEVADTGCGMSEATRLRMFDPFFTTKPHGHGLGLAAIQGIVRGHRGGITVYSEEGEGTTIRVLFPATDRLPTPPEPTRTMVPTGPATVLVVDDDAHVREFACAALEQAGFSVLEASDGDEAVACFQSDPDRVSLVLLDLTMPRMDGEATFRELRRIRPDVAVILSSGHNQQDAITRFAGKGLADFLQKPYRAADLVARVRGRVSVPK